MQTKVKNFIEKHIDLLENDPVEFWQIAADFLTSEEISDIIDSLRHAGVDIDDERFIVLNEFLSNHLKDIKQGTPLNTFFSKNNYVFGKGFLGLSLNQLKLHIIDDAKELGVKVVFSDFLEDHVIYPL